MSNFDITDILTEDFPVIGVSGYLAAEAGERLHEVVFRHLKEGRVKIILDFANCTLINSPGAVILTDLILEVSQDYKGMVIAVGLDGVKITILKMTGAANYCQTGKNIQEGVDKLKKE